jgi:hypothetical protein
VCCFGCRQRAAAGYYVAQAPPAVAAAPSPCCPQPVCTTRYTMRCYYQPITTYQTRTYYEPVTTYRTSYYYEPVCSYRYSCYFDPCSCSYQQVAVPTTSYQLRSQCCPVQSWVQRCCSVPVTSYQRCCYWEPQTCCSTPVAAPCAGAVGVQAPAVGVPSQPPPNVEDQRLVPRPPAVNEQRNGGGTGSPNYDRYYGPQDYMPPASYRQLPAAPGPARPANPVQPPPQVRPDRITSAPVTQLEGQVVRGDNAPRPNAQVRFVSANPRGPQLPVTANSAGRFRVTLASGSWLVYLDGPDGRPAFHSKIDVTGDARRITLVSR